MNPTPETLRIFGADYPVIKPLRAPKIKEEGWFLVAHPNGPAIANNWGNPEGGFLGTLSHKHDDVPDNVRDRAIEVYVSETFSLLRPTYYTK